nr:endonuclease/exonuclease/phosphatase family protein [Consotaella salsifontis]
MHSGIGADRRHDVSRIARALDECDAAVVALQEVDVGRRRTDFAHQANHIGQELGMHVHFHPALEIEDEDYGDAILTKMPSRLMKAGLLPGLKHRPRLEPRGAIWVEIEIGGQAIQVINTHLGLNRRERMAQVEELLGERWLGSPLCRDPVVLLGDFNALPRSTVFARLAGALTDARRTAPEGRSPATFPSRFPLLRLDHVFTRGAVTVRSLAVPRTPLTRAASDHLPLVVELEFDPGTKTSTHVPDRRPA